MAIGNLYRNGSDIDTIYNNEFSAIDLKMVESVLRTDSFFETTIKDKELIH